MTKQDIDVYFTTNYNSIKKTTQSRLWCNKKGYIEPDVVINNCYIHIYENIDKIINTNTLESFIYKYITNESYWTNGKANKQEQLSHFELFDNYDTEDDQSDLNEKIEYEIKLQNQKYLLEAFYQSLNRQDKNVYEMYFWKGKNTNRSLAAYLGISKGSAQKVLFEFRKQMQEFILKNKNK